MKKVILLALMLLSGLANATKVYDHIAGFRSLRHWNDQYTFVTKYIATYTKQMDGVTEGYVSIFGHGTDRQYLLNDASKVNNIRAYELNNFPYDAQGYYQGGVNFIATNGALYIMYEDFQLYPMEVRELHGYNVIDVVKMRDNSSMGMYRFVIIATKKENDVTKTYVSNMKFITSFHHYEISSGPPFDIKATSVDGSSGYLSNQLVLVGGNRLMILKNNDSGGWEVSHREKEGDRDKFVVLHANLLQRFKKINVLLYKGASNKWEFNGDILDNLNNFKELPLDSATTGPDYFDNTVLYPAGGEHEVHFCVRNGLNTSFKAVDLGDGAPNILRTVAGDLVATNLFYGDNLERYDSPQLPAPGILALIKNSSGRYEIYGTMVNPETHEIEVKSIYNLPE